MCEHGLYVVFTCLLPAHASSITCDFTRGDFNVFHDGVALFICALACMHVEA